MTKDILLNSIKADLDSNYRNDDVIDVLFEEVLNDALFISNRTKL